MTTRPLPIRSFRMLLVALAGLVLVPGARAALPEDQVVEYQIRANPADPQSAVVMSIRLEIAAADQMASTVGWEITQAHFLQYSTEGELLAAWSVERPEVDSADGLWWVEHEHVEEPAIAEFNTVPTISGAAPRSVGMGADLLFSIAPGSLATPYLSYYGGAVAGMTYALQEEGEEEDVIAGDDEPCEVD